MMPWRKNLSLKKCTFCDDWTKIVAQGWFGARIYPRALTLGSWPLNFRINFINSHFHLLFLVWFTCFAYLRGAWASGNGSNGTTNWHQWWWGFYHSNKRQLWRFTNLIFKISNLILTIRCPFNCLRKKLTRKVYI